MGKKFRKFIATSIVVLAGTILISCGEKNFRVSFVLNGGSAVESQVILENGLVTAPTNPTKENAIFGGWYKDSACTIPWNFSEDKVTADTAIFAKWIESSEIIIPQTTLDNDGYTLSVVGGGSNVSINGSFELKLEINTEKFIIDNFVLLRNGNQVETPASYDEEEGKRIYTYSFSEVVENQEFSVIGLVPKFYIATFDASEFYTIIDVEGVRTSINYGTDYSFKINLLEGYTDSVATMSVYNGQTRLYPDSNGIYKIENVTSNLSIDINKVYKNIYSISYPASSEQTPRFEVQGLGTTFHGEDVSFKIKLANEYSKIELDKLIDIKVSGISVSATHTFDKNAREYTFNIPAEKVTGNIIVALNDRDWEVDKYIISFPSVMVGYSLSSDYTEISAGKYEVPFGGDFEFYVKLDNDYRFCQDFKVMVGNYNFTSDLFGTTNDKVEIKNIRSDYEIRLENLTKNSYTVEVPENAGYEIVLADGYSLPAEAGSEVKFDIRVLEEAGYEQVVPDLGTLNGILEYYDNPYTSEDESKELTATPILIYKNGHYTISAISGNVKLNVAGIEKKKFTTSVSVYDGFTIENMPESLTYGETYTFDVVVDEDYLDSLNNNEIKAKVNGRTLSGRNNFDENKITFTININSSLLSAIGSGKVIPIEITGVAKNYYNLTFSLETPRISGAYFKNYESLGEGYSENSYTIKVKRGASGTINSVAPNAEIVVPEHYEINSARPWLTNNLVNINELTGDTTFYVDFTPIKYEIRFNLNGGENAKENNTNGGSVPVYTYDIETPINLADPTKEIIQNSGKYYDFLGWFVEEDSEQINIKDFVGYKNIIVSASWGIKVGENEARKTLAEATILANSGDKIIVLESAVLGSQVSIMDKEIEIVGESEDVTIFVDNISSMNVAFEVYSLINVINSNALKISNLNFELDESIVSKVVAFNITRSNAELSDMSFKNLGLMKALINEGNVVLVDNVSVEDNKNNYAVTALSDNTGEINIQNSNFKVFKGILVEANETYLGSLKVTIENNTFEKVALIEEIEGEISTDIKVVGIHDIQSINNSHLNTILGAEFIVFENGLSDILVKEDIEKLISKISVDAQNSRYITPIKLYSIKEALFGTDDYGGPIYEILKIEEVLYNFENQTYTTYIYYGDESAVKNALEFSDILNIELDINIPFGNYINIEGNVEIPENVEVWVKSGTLILAETSLVSVNGILNIYGNIENGGNIKIGTNGEIVNHQKIKLGTYEENGNVISKLELELGENNTGKISGAVVEASKTSKVYGYYKNAPNATFHFVSFQVYVGVEKAGATLSDIVISNENGLLYSTGTTTSANLTDVVNPYGYIDVILDANVKDGAAKLSKATISFAGETYEIDMELIPYAPEVLADESYAMGYIFGSYPNSEGIYETYIFNTLQTISENKDESLVSDKDNFFKLIASGSLAKVKENSNADNVAPESSSDHFVTFRQYVGLQYAGSYVSETYAINGVQREEILNLYVLEQNANNKNRVDDEGYLHYIFDANVSYLTVHGVWFSEKVNVETIQVFFTLDSETYEIRVDLKDMLVYNRTSTLDILLGNTVDLGIDNRYNIISFAEDKYTISGGVYKVGENEAIKNNETFYNASYTASGYFASYRIFTTTENGAIKPLIGKQVSFEVSGYAGKTWCGGKVLANGYIEFITELLESGGTIQNGELTIIYQVEGEEAKTITIVLGNFEILEDKAGLDYAILHEDISINDAGSGVNLMNYSITPVEEGLYKVESLFFEKTAENSVAYNNPYAEVDSTGYFVVFTAFAGVRAWGDLVQFNLSYQKGGNEIKSETRELEVNDRGYVGIFVDTLTEGTELGLDTLLISFKNVDNEETTYTIDFSEIVVAEYETE